MYNEVSMCHQLFEKKFLPIHEIYYNYNYNYMYICIYVYMNICI